MEREAKRATKDESFTFNNQILRMCFHCYFIQSVFFKIYHNLKSFFTNFDCWPVRSQEAHIIISDCIQRLSQEPFDHSEFYILSVIFIVALRMPCLKKLLLILTYDIMSTVLYRCCLWNNIYIEYEYTLTFGLLFPYTFGLNFP